MLDEFLVGGALLASIICALFTLGPRAMRRAVLMRTVAVLRRLPAVVGVRSLARRLEAAAANKPAGACGGCDDCGSAPAEPEVRIPVSKIGKR